MYTVFEDHVRLRGKTWVKQPNRLVKIFPSGLCMIQQDFISVKKRSMNYAFFQEGDRLEEDYEPCIDNAYIYPTPDYQDMGNGFIKCTVTAYGRVNTTGSIESNLTASLIQRGASKFTENFTVEVPSIFGNLITRAQSSTDTIVTAFSEGFIENLVKRYVIHESEQVVKPLDKEFKIFDQNGGQIIYPIDISLGEGRSISYNYDPSIYDPAATRTETVNRTYSLNGRIEIVPVFKNYQTTVFGKFIEVTATYSPSFKLQKFF